MELLVVLGIIILIAVFSIPLFVNWQATAELGDTASNIKSQIDLARSRSQAGLNNSDHGIYFDSSGKKIVLFQGSTYPDRNFSYDQIMELSDSLGLQTTLAGDVVVFTKSTGRPLATGTITILRTDSAEIREIIINTLGLADIE